MADRIQWMIGAADVPHVPYLQFLKLRSAHPAANIFVLEGSEDIAFYDAQLKKSRGDLSFVPLVVNGKDNVLDVRRLLNLTLSSKSKVYFFVDQDFDQLKGHSPGPDLYMTPSYSFENLLVNETVFNSLLQAEFKLDVDELITDLTSLQQVFRLRLEEFLNHMEEANALILNARHNKLKCKGITNQINKYVSIKLDSVSKVYSRADTPNLLGLPVHPSVQDLTNGVYRLRKLDPELFCRGKYIYGFFIDFLSRLKEDRTTKTPQYFSKKKTINFEAKNDHIRSLASCAPVPQCLQNFFARMV